MIVQRVYDPSRRHDYEEYETVCGTLESRMGTGGGNVPIVVEQFVLELDTTIKIGGGCCFTIGGTRQVPIVVETLVFDEGQITCPTNGLNPKWGGVSLTVR